MDALAMIRDIVLIVFFVIATIAVVGILVAVRRISEQVKPVLESVQRVTETVHGITQSVHRITENGAHAADIVTNGILGPIAKGVGFAGLAGKAFNAFGGMFNKDKERTAEHNDNGTEHTRTR
ncbi:MAG: hypothetical protein EXR67_02800 [Dehalococcoidia bacterium]|nr:hypothetical protein [Dehalococcoidia bacterium]